VTVKRRALLLSIHDVTPAHASTIRRAIHFLRERGVATGALLIVPDFHNTAPLGGDKPFCRFVVDLIDEGWEPILHGYSHLDEQLRKPSSLRERFSSKHMTASEGEFLLLDRDQASQRVEAGREVLKSTINASPTGFVPPAWLCSDEARDALRTSGFRHSEDHVFIEDLVARRRFFAPALGWASRSLGRRLSSSSFAYLSTPMLALLPAVRFALHPGDFQHRGLMRSIEFSLEYFQRAGFHLTSYSDFLASNQT